MMVWVLHVPQIDGSVIVKVCNSTNEAWKTLEDAGVKFSSAGGSSNPKIGDRYVFYNGSTIIGYAVLGQIRFN